MEATAVTWAVLGLLVQRPRSGYEVKQAVDRAIRHFWAASYGQIYPELKRLEEAGLIAGGESGARAKRVYRATKRGECSTRGSATRRSVTSSQDHRRSRTQGSASDAPRARSMGESGNL